MPLVGLFTRIIARILPGSPFETLLSPVLIFSIIISVGSSTCKIASLSTSLSVTLFIMLPVIRTIIMMHSLYPDKFMPLRMSIFVVMVGSCS